MSMKTTDERAGKTPTPLLGIEDLDRPSLMQQSGAREEKPDGEEDVEVSAKPAPKPQSDYPGPYRTIGR